MIGDIPVVVSAHGALNFSRGVISEGELLHVSEDEILEGLREQHVCAVRRITIRRDGQLLPTKHLILTFDSPSLPKDIKAGYLQCPVRPFIPNPLRCFQCQRFGHSKASCRGSAVCPRCAEADHADAPCTCLMKCVNCKGAHTAFSRSCPQWIKEKEIQTLKVKENISFYDARQRVESRTPRIGLSYAAAVKESRTISTQTDPPLPTIPPQKQVLQIDTTNSKSPKSVQTRILDPRGLFHKPLNEALPHHKLRPRTQTVKSRQKSFQESHSPVQKRNRKSAKLTAQALTKNAKERHLPDIDAVSLHPSDDEGSLQSGESDAAMELSETCSDASGIRVPLPSSS